MANNKPIRTRRIFRRPSAFERRVVRDVKRSIERSAGSKVHLLDFTCVPGGGNPVTDGCPDLFVTNVPSPASCLAHEEFVLAGPEVMDPLSTDPNLPLMLSHVDLDMYFAPSLLEQFACDEENANQAVLFRARLYVRDELDDALTYNPFANGQDDESAPHIIKEWQHLWWPKSSTTVMLSANSNPFGDPCLPPASNTTGPFWPASDNTGTVVGGAQALLTTEEAAPWHLKARVRHKVHIKDRRQLCLLIAYGNPFNECGLGDGVNFVVNCMGFVRAHLTKAL